MADCAVRILHLKLPAPEHYADKEPVELCVVHALEANPPPGTEPVEWFLLTTMNVVSSADAEQCLRWYTLRRAIGINLVIAWQIMLMTLLGRKTPELPAEILFSDVEIRTLRAYAKKKNKISHTSG